MTQSQLWNVHQYHIIPNEWELRALGTCNGSHVNRWDRAFFSALLRAAIASHGSEAKIRLRRRLPLQVGVGVAAAMTWVGRVIAVICGELEMVTDRCFYVSAPRRASKNWWCPPESGRWWRTDCKMYAPFVESSPALILHSFHPRLQCFLTGIQGYKNKKEMRWKCQMDFPSRKSVRMLQGEEAWGKTCSL